MSLSEIRGMPMTAEATGNQLAAIWKGEPVWNLDIAFRQERYVREVSLRCPWWRPWKKAALAYSVRRVTAVANLSFFGWNKPPPKPTDPTDTETMASGAARENSQVSEASKAVPQTRAGSKGGVG